MAEWELCFCLAWRTPWTARASTSKNKPRGADQSEGGWALVGDGEGALEGDADAAESAFVEEAADQGDAVGDAARGRKFWERIFGIGGPVRTRFGDLDEACAQGERRVAGVVADGEHFVAERRHEQQVHLREDARHFLRYFAAEAVGLDEIHGGEEARLAEKVWPVVRGLHFELVHAVAQG